MDCQPKIFRCWLIILFVIIQVDDVLPSRLICSTDCSAQAGVPCKVASSSTECPKPKVDEDSNYPDQPGTIDIFPKPNGEGIGLNVTWQYEYNGLITGFKLIYDTYYNFEDATRSTLDQCALFNFTSQQVPSGQVTFSHNCIRKPTRIIYLAALPQQTPSKDYIHRVTAGFKQDHGDNKAQWQPELIVIHNDSCHSRVEVELYLAPEKFNFVHYIIGLQVTDKYMDYKNQRYDITVNPKEKSTNVTFNDVQDGVYTIIVIVKPVIQGGFHSETGAFILQKDHPKCKEHTIPGNTVPPTYSTTVPPTYSTTVSPTYSTTVSPTYSTTVSPTYSTTVSPTYSTTVSPTYSTTVSPTYSTTVPPTYSNTVSPTYYYMFTIFLPILASLSGILFLVTICLVLKQHINHKKNTLDRVQKDWSVISPVCTADFASIASEPGVQPCSELNSIAISSFSNDVRKQNNINSTNFSQIDDDEEIPDSDFESTEDAQPKDRSVMYPVCTAGIASSAFEPDVKPYGKLNSVAISNFSNDVRKQNNRNSSSFSQIDDDTEVPDSDFKSTKDEQPKMLYEVENYHQQSLNYNETNDPSCTSLYSDTGKGQSWV